MSARLLAAAAVVLTLAGCGTTKAGQRGDGTTTIDATSSTPPPTATVEIEAEDTTSEERAVEPEVEVESEVDPESEDTGGYVGLYASNYIVSRDTCAYYSLKRLAREYGVKPTMKAVARAHSLGLKEGLHREASYEGCLAGIRSRD